MEKDSGFGAGDQSFNLLAQEQPFYVFGDAHNENIPWQISSDLQQGLNTDYQCQIQHKKQFKLLWLLEILELIYRKKKKTGLRGMLRGPMPIAVHIMQVNPSQD